MAINIPSANVSPRNDNGILKFYEGDTFTFNLYFELEDQDNKEIILDGNKDSIVITFYDYKNRIVKTFSFGKGKDEAILEGNIVELDFDEETSKLFEEGKYSYDGVVEIEGIGKRTIINKAPVLVE